MKDYIVKTNSGSIKGYERNGLTEYLGIPYAKPPVGELRLKRAVPNSWEGVFDAKEYGPESVQYADGAACGSEDCLTLNVKAPVGAKNLPVMVYIHGGGYNTGSASTPLYAGDAFAKKDIVYISIQYRLSVWGFYDFSVYEEGKDFDSNCGVSDMILAMQWIHENIAAFGGDPNRVTISGESAGGTSMLLLMAAPKAKGTFQQVIMSSGIVNGFFSREMSKKNTELFLEGMGWTTKDIPKLKDIDAYEVLKGNEYMAEMHQYKNPGIFLPSPVIDDLLPKRPLDAVREGSAAGIRLIISNNRHEGTMFVRPEKTNFPNSWEMVEEMFSKNHQEDAYQAIKDYYEPHNTEEINGVGMGFVDFATDYVFQVPAMQVAKAQKAYGDVWMYRFDFASDFMTKIGLLAGHAMELTYEFDEKEFGMMAEEMKGPQKDIVCRLTDEMHTAWVEFIKNGDPMQNQWSQYEDKDGVGAVRVYDKETTIQELDRSEILKLWDGLTFYQE